MLNVQIEVMDTIVAFLHKKWRIKKDTGYGVVCFCFSLCYCLPMRKPVNTRLPPRKNFVKTTSYQKIKMSGNIDDKDILNSTTQEIVLGTSENGEENEANEIVGPVQVHEPVIQLIDLVSESGSVILINDVKTGNENLPENLSYQVPSWSSLYRKWHRGINPEDTSTPAPSEPTREPAKEPFDIRIEYLQRFIQENEGFNDLCGQPGAEWPGILGKKGLRKEYKRVYNYAEKYYPEVLEYNDYPHPSIIERDVPNPRMAPDRADSGGADIGADLRRFFTERRRSQSAAAGLESSEKQEKPRFKNLVRPSPPPPTHQLPPRPSTSTGALSWQETKKRLLPLNLASKKLVSEEFAREIEVSNILEFKPVFEDHEGIHDTVNNAIRNHVGRRQRFLEAYKKIQDQTVQHLREIDPNPGRYEYKPVETKDQSGESLPETSLHRLVPNAGYYQSGPCTPQCCVCGDDKCIWNQANYTD
jgi:hypothetical protein